MTNNELIVLMHEFEGCGGKIKLQTRNNSSKKSARVSCFINVNRGFGIPGGIQFHLLGGYVNILLEKTDLVNLENSIIYDNEEDCKNLYFGDIRLAFYKKSKEFNEILSNIKSLTQKYEKSLAELY